MEEIFYIFVVNCKYVERLYRVCFLCVYYYEFYIIFNFRVFIKSIYNYRLMIYEDNLVRLVVFMLLMMMNELVLVV